MFEADTEFITVTKIHTVDKYTDKSDTPKRFRYSSYFASDELVFFLYGENETTIDNVLLHDRPNFVRYMPKGQTDSEYTVLSKPPSCCIDIYFNSSVPLAKQVFGMNDAVALRSKFLRIYNIWNEKQHGYYSEAMMILYDIIHHIQIQNAAYLTSQSKQAVSKAYDYILKNYRSHDFNYKMLYEISGLKHSRFNSLFKQNYGITAMELVTDMKLQHAKELLVTARYSMAEIADLCGFENQYYFSSVFKKSTGVPPSQYKSE